MIRLGLQQRSPQTPCSGLHDLADYVVANHVRAACCILDEDIPTVVEGQ